MRVEERPRERLKRYVAPDKEGAVEKTVPRSMGNSDFKSKQSSLSPFGQIRLQGGQLRCQTRRRAAAAPGYMETMMLFVSTPVRYTPGVSTGNQTRSLADTDKPARRV